MLYQTITQLVMCPHPPNPFTKGYCVEYINNIVEHCYNCMFLFRQRLFSRLLRGWSCAICVCVMRFHGLHGVASDAQHPICFTDQLYKCIDTSDHGYVVYFIFTWNLCVYEIRISFFIVFIHLYNKHVMPGIGHSYIVVVIS